MGLIVPILFLLFGTGGGIAAGIFLKPRDEPMVAETLDQPCGPTEGSPSDSHTTTSGDGHSTQDGGYEYARLNNQFIVPVVNNDRVSGLVVMSLSVEVPTGQTSLVFEHEPKLRDAFLQVLFDHANLGGFNGQFTSGQNMRGLRNALLQAGQTVIGSAVSDVLILDLVKQDV